MDRENIIIILGILKTAYPSFYKEMSTEEAEKTIELWRDMFKNENFEIVIIAVKNLINTFKYPPTIADVKEQIYKLQNVEVDDTIDLYNKLKKALSNSIYGAKEEFDKLPPIVQKFVGTPQQLRNWETDVNFNDEVLRGQFYKQVEILRKRQKEEKMMLPEVKAKINELVEKTNAIKFLN